MRAILAAILGAALLSCGGDGTAPASPGDDSDAEVDATLPPRADAALEAAAPDGAAPPADAADASVAPIDAGRSVLQHHNHPSRDGLYVDPRMTKAAAATLHRDPTFHGVVDGEVYAQPLYVEQGPNGVGAFYVATENDTVHALDARSGAPLWERTLGTPVPLAKLPCGIFDPLGISGAPIVDLATRALFLDAMVTPDDGTTKRHLVFALSIDDGHTLPGWPVDVAAQVDGGAFPFNAPFQGQRGALAIADGVVYVPYAGHHGDCGDYHGWVVAIPIADPAHPTAWAVPVAGGGIWGPGGLATDGKSIFAITGNTGAQPTWQGGEAIVRLTRGAVFSGSTADYFAPANWQDLDRGDLDLGGSGALLLDLPDSAPSQIVAAFGKDGFAYLRDRNALGGVDDGGVKARVSSGSVTSAFAAYTTATGTYVSMFALGQSCPPGTGGEITTLRIRGGAPPTIETVWCGFAFGYGSPIVTTTDGHSDAIVWVVGAAGGMQVHALDGETGVPIFDGPKGDVMTNVFARTSPIEVDGRIVVASKGALNVFTIDP